MTPEPDEAAYGEVSDDDEEEEDEEEELDKEFEETETGRDRLFGVKGAKEDDEDEEEDSEEVVREIGGAGETVGDPPSSTCVAKY